MMCFLLCIVLYVAIGLYFCSKSKSFLESAIGRYLFVTYYQFDFDNTVCYTNLICDGVTQSSQDTAAQFCAEAQFGVVLKKIANPLQLEFFPVGLHQGAFNESLAQKPLVSFATYVRSIVSNESEVNRIATTMMHENLRNKQSMQAHGQNFLVQRAVDGLQQQPKRFTESFQTLFEALLQDPSARISFHVFDMDHVFELARMIPSEHATKFYSVQFADVNDETPLYVEFDIQKPAALPSSPPTISTSFLFAMTTTTQQPKPTLSEARYHDLTNHTTQTSVFLKQHDTHAIHVIREDKERFDLMGKQATWGKHGLAALSVLTLFKIVRWVVFDDKPCWNASYLQGRFVHVNPLFAMHGTWMSSRAKPQSVLTTIGFWNIVCWLSFLCYVSTVIGGFFAMCFDGAIVIGLLSLLTKNNWPWFLVWFVAFRMTLCFC